jgi:hypothetical protein
VPRGALAPCDGQYALVLGWDPRSRPPVLRGTEYHDGPSVAADAARAPGDRVVIEPPRNTRIRCPSRSSFSGGPANTVHSPRGLAR